MCMRHHVTSATRKLSPAGHHFYGETIVSDAISCVKRCHDCQLNTSSYAALYGLTKPLPTPQRPWSIISIDFTTGSPTSQNNTGAKVDSHTSFAVLYRECAIITTTKNITAQQIACLYYDNNNNNTSNYSRRLTQLFDPHLPFKQFSSSFISFYPFFYP